MTSINEDVLRAKAKLGQELAAGVWTVGAIMLGVRLGLYDAMAGAGALTSDEVATRAGLHERLVREWLFQQVAAGVLEHRPPDRFEITAEAFRVFADTNNPSSLSGAFSEAPRRFATFELAEEAFRTGVGQVYGALKTPEEISRGPLQAWCRSALVPIVLPKLEGLPERLEAGGFVADIGCGAGAAPMAIARAFPSATVYGYDTWDAALEFCAQASAAEDLRNVSFHNPERHPIPDTPAYDLVLTMDVLHDLPRPDVMASTIRGALRPDGFWFIVEPDGAENEFDNLKKPFARAAFGASIMTCLQVGTSEAGGMALGSLGLHESRLRELVIDAGFSRLERVPGIEHAFNAYYIARPSSGRPPRHPRFRGRRALRGGATTRRGW